MRSKSRRRKHPNPMDRLPDDLVVDILSRLPVKSLCRCNGVSRRWRSLISHEDNSRKLPQTLTGLFYSSFGNRCPSLARHFTSVWQGPRHPLVCPSLSFLAGYERISIVDSCNGMLLCRFSESDLHDAFRYVLCNPVEKSTIVLPDTGCGAKKRVARLAFDPTLYPEIHVFEFVYGDTESNDIVLVGANIYSTETGAWSYKEGGWGPEAYFLDTPSAKCVFYNGYLHLVNGRYGVYVVDVEGETWDTIPLPAVANSTDSDSDYNISGFIGIYKEHLCYIGQANNTSDLSIWILEDYEKDDWVLEHQVSINLLCEKEIGRYFNKYYCDVFGILQDCNFLLYVACKTLMAYDVDNEEVHVIQNLEQVCIAPFFPVCAILHRVIDKWLTKSFSSASVCYLNMVSERHDLSWAKNTI